MYNFKNYLKLYSVFIGIDTLLIQCSKAYTGYSVSNN